VQKLDMAIHHFVMDDLAGDPEMSMDVIQAIL
jgi:hypothetical protein